MKINEDKNYEDPVLTEQFKNSEKQLNRNAATLVLVCINKLFELLVKLCEDI